jgi:hypothetical protein
LTKSLDGEFLSVLNKGAPVNRKYLLAAPTLVIAMRVAKSDPDWQPVSDFGKQLKKNARQALDHGRQIFRLDTLGDESFRGDTSRLHQAIEGTWFGGVGRSLNPKTALAAGLKVDVEALPRTLVAALTKEVKGSY